MALNQMNDSNQTLVSYLLGEMAEADETALEEKYFADQGLFDELVEAENELTDKYARLQLSPDTQRRFEQYYLAYPRRLERARFAQALTARVDQNKLTARATSSAEPWWSRLSNSVRAPKLAWGLALALLFLVAGVGWLAFQTRRLRQELARGEIERASQEQRQRDLQQQLAGERARTDQMTSELDRVRSGQPGNSPTPTASNAPALATLILNVSGIRDAETAAPLKLNLPSGTEKVRIQLNLRDVDYTSYSLLIQSADGRQIFKREGLKSIGGTRVSFSVIVPANKLVAGDYILTLKGVTPSGDVDDVSKSLFRVSQSAER